MPRVELVPDCEKCAALCCVALPFDASESFAFSKRAGVRCRHLCGNRCAIHPELRQRGMGGCAAFDCYGAGQRVTREVPEEERLAAFFVMREVHELMWLLTEAAGRCAPEHAPVIEAQLRTLEMVTHQADLRRHRAVTFAVLRLVLLR